MGEDENGRAASKAVSQVMLPLGGSCHEVTEGADDHMYKRQLSAFRTALNVNPLQRRFGPLKQRGALPPSAASPMGEDENGRAASKAVSQVMLPLGGSCHEVTEGADDHMYKRQR